MLPEIKDAFGLGRVQVGAITATRELAGGLVMLPSGIILDVLRPYWGIVLSLCMLGFGLDSNRGFPYLPHLVAGDSGGLGVRIDLASSRHGRPGPPL